MVKLKNLVTKYWVAISFVISFVIDAQYNILEQFIEDTFWVNIIKGLGAFVLAYMTNKGLSNNGFFSKEENPDDEGIGGGGIKNPKP